MTYRLVATWQWSTSKSTKEEHWSKVNFSTPTIFGDRNSSNMALYFLSQLNDITFVYLWFLHFYIFFLIKIKHAYLGKKIKLDLNQFELDQNVTQNSTTDYIDYWMSLQNKFLHQKTIRITVIFKQKSNHVDEDFVAIRNTWFSQCKTRVHVLLAWNANASRVKTETRARCTQLVYLLSEQ